MYNKLVNDTYLNNKLVHNLNFLKKNSYLNSKKIFKKRKLKLKIRLFSILKNTRKKLGYPTKTKKKVKYHKGIKIRDLQKIKKKALNYGVLRVLFKKRNIFCTISSEKGKIYHTISSGLLKVTTRKGIVRLKGRQRQALHKVKAAAQLIINHIFKRRLFTYIIIHKGKSFRKKKKTFFKAFKNVKKLKFLKINRPAPKSHNGCRPSKIRRK
jgi:ribosomal protein S11